MKHAMYIRQLTLIEMPGLRPQFRRPFDIVGRPEELSEVLDAILKDPDDVNEERVSAQRLSPHVNRFLRYSGHAQPAFAPPLGWDTPRYAFQLEVEVKQIAYSGKQTLIVLGFTDDTAGVADGPIADSILDHVQFHINSVITSRTRYQNTEMGGGAFHQMVANQHLYSDPDSTGFNKIEWLETLRPCDIFSRLAMEADMVGIDMATVIDTRTVVTHMPRTSDRLNVNPAYLLERVLGGYLTTKDSTPSGLRPNWLFEDARSHVEESPAGMNPLLRELVGEREVGPSKTFKMSDLLRLDASVKDRSVIVVGNARDNDLVVGGQYASLDEESLEAYIGYALAVNVPAFLAKAGIARAAFSLRSPGTSGNPRETGLEFEMMDMGGFGAEHSSGSKEEFFLDLLSVILPQVTANFTIPLFLEMEANLNGLSTIDVRLKLDGEKKHFVVPTFMDGLISPVLARRTDLGSELATVAGGIGGLIRLLDEKMPTA
jgi:hypothetical protein